MQRITRRLKLNKTYTYQGDGVNLEFGLDPTALKDLQEFRDLLKRAIQDVEDDIALETVAQSKRK